MASLLFNDKENILNRMRRSYKQRKLVYRELLNKVGEILESEDVGLTTVNEIGGLIREANALDNELSINERVEHADETLLDFQILSSSSSILCRCSELLDVFASVYEQSEFTEKTLNNIKNPEYEEVEPDDFLKLLHDARTIIPKVPSYNSVYGSYDLHSLPQPKQKKERVKQTREKLQKKEPERIMSLDKEEEGIEEIVKLLLDVLREKYVQNNQQPVKYYDYVIDTDEFSNTVENVFYFSFLIRDGRAEIDLDSKGNPIIRPVPKEELKRFRTREGINTQILTCITMAQWKKHKRPGFIQQRRVKSNK